MKQLSLLQRVTSADIQSFPFPHIVVPNALPSELHDELRTSFPSPDELGIDSTQDNYRWSTKALDLPKTSEISELWREFIRYHSSHLFWSEVVRVFGQSICNHFPHHFQSPEQLLLLESAVRDMASEGKNPLMLDAQISGNTPAITPGVPRGVHFDSPNALYAGLYYLRQVDDCSEGGDLQIWHWKTDYSDRKKAAAYKEGVATRHVQLFKTVRYQSNTLVFLLNTLDSLHSVTERQPTKSTRQFVNLVCDTPSPLFDLRPFIHQRAINFIKRAIRGLA
jgi:hypothetical protein